MVAVIADTIQRISFCGKSVGVLTGDEAAAHRFIDSGCAFMAVGSDLESLARGSASPD